MQDYNQQNSPQLTKKERYLLKRQQKEKGHLRLIRKKKIKKAMSVFGIVFFVGAAIYLVVGSMGRPQEAQGGTPKIEINQQEYNAGIVSMAEGLVKHTYEVINSGDGDLEIDRIWTSCMCTTAVLKTGEKKSPEFGMHDNPAFWSEKIAPGKTGFLEVTFDPAFHGPEGVGDITRAIYISSDDPQNPKVQVILSAQVTL